MNNKELRVMVIGLWGHEVYARQVLGHPAVKPVAFCAYDNMRADERKRLADLAAEHGMKCEPGWQELLAESAPDICVVMAAPAQAAQILSQTLLRDIHTLTEKPFAANSAQVGKLAQILTNSRATFTTCLPIPRYAAPYKLAWERIRAGEIGEILQVSFTYLASKGPLYIARDPHYRDSDIGEPCLSGGEAAMFAGYGVAALEWFAGARISSVFARAGSFFYDSYQQQCMEDMASCLVKFGERIRGSITVGRTPSRTMPAYIGFDITGTRGNLAYDSRRQNSMISVYPGYSQSGNNAEEGSVAFQVAARPDVESLGENFVDAVLHQRDPRLTREDALSFMAVLSAIYRSAATGEEIAVERKIT